MLTLLLLAVMIIDKPQRFINLLAKSLEKKPKKKKKPDEEEEKADNGSLGE